MQGILIKDNQVVLKITLIIDKLFHGGMYMERLILTFLTFVPLKLISLMKNFVSHYVGITYITILILNVFFGNC